MAKTVFFIFRISPEALSAAVGAGFKVAMPSFKLARSPGQPTQVGRWKKRLFQVIARRIPGKH
jgi:hypothetical protein